MTIEEETKGKKKTLKPNFTQKVLLEISERIVNKSGGDEIKISWRE